MKKNTHPNLHSLDIDLGGCSLIDTHCHLDMQAYQNDLDLVLERATLGSVNRIVCIGVNLTSSANCIGLARHNTRLAATIGIHPHDVDLLQESDYQTLERLYKDNSKLVSAVGEIGLDYFHHRSSTENQRRHFRKQLDLAHEWRLPVVIHNREADADIIEILAHAKPLDYGGVMHCFSSDIAFAEKALDLGLMISITGVVTFKKSEKLQEVAQRIPLTSMLLETDGPYLSPHPYRGKRNEPAFLPITAGKIAELRNIPLAEVARQTTRNAEQLFSLNKC